MNWGESAFAPYATLIHLFNKGSQKALNAVLRALRAYAALGGYDTVVTMDFNDKPRAVGVLFRRVGLTAKPLAVAYRATSDGE
jgi:hypothetical protein